MTADDQGSDDPENEEQRAVRDRYSPSSYRDATADDPGDDEDSGSGPGSVDTTLTLDTEAFNDALRSAAARIAEPSKRDRVDSGTGPDRGIRIREPADEYAWIEPMRKRDIAGSDFCITIDTDGMITQIPGDADVTHDAGGDPVITFEYLDGLAFESRHLEIDYDAARDPGLDPSIDSVTIRSLTPLTCSVCGTPTRDPVNHGFRHHGIRLNPSTGD